MRLLPNAKVCFLGGCPPSGRNQDLFRREIAKQKTEEPQGAASLSFAVLESDGRKREVAIGDAVNWDRRIHAESINVYQCRPM